MNKTAIVITLLGVAMCDSLNRKLNDVNINDCVVCLLEDGAATDYHWYYFSDTQ